MGKLRNFIFSAIVDHAQGHIQPADGRIDSGRLSPASGICGYFSADNIEI